MPNDSASSLSELLSQHKTAAALGDARLATLACDLANDQLFLHRSSVRNWSTGGSKSVKNWRQMAALATVLRLDRAGADELLQASGWPSVEELGRTAQEEDRVFLSYWDDQPITAAVEAAEPDPTENVAPVHTPVAPMAEPEVEERKKRGGLLLLAVATIAVAVGLVAWLTTSGGTNNAEVLAEAVTPTPAASATAAPTAVAQPDEDQPAQNPPADEDAIANAAADPVDGDATPTPNEEPSEPTSTPNDSSNQTNPDPDNPGQTPTATPVPAVATPVPVVPDQPTPVPPPTSTPTPTPTPIPTPTATPTPTPTATPVTTTPPTTPPVGPSSTITSPAAGSSWNGMPGLILAGTASNGGGVKDVAIVLTNLTAPQRYWDPAAGSLVTNFTDFSHTVASPGAASTSWSYQVPAGLPSGNYRVRVWTRGSNNVNDPDGTIVEFSVNTGLPRSVITGPGANVAAGTPVVFSGTSTFALGVQDVVIAVVNSGSPPSYWNGTEWQSSYTQLEVAVNVRGAATVTWSYQLPSLDPGTYRVRVWARGATSPPQNEDTGPILDFTVS